LGPGGDLMLRNFEDRISGEIGSQIAPGTYYYLWGHIGEPC